VNTIKTLWWHCECHLPHSTYSINHSWTKN